MTFTMPEKVDGFTLPTMKIQLAGTHMHWAGTDMNIQIDRKTAASNEPAHECLIGTPNYDFNWQRSYAYDQSFDDLPSLGPGDKLTFTCTYDNTLNNPRVVRALEEQHKNAPVDIKLGETTLDEMCLGVFVVLRPLIPGE
jgi:hypothetical protein